MLRNDNYNNNRKAKGDRIIKPNFPFPLEFHVENIAKTPHVQTVIGPCKKCGNVVTCVC